MKPLSDRQKERIWSTRILWRICNHCGGKGDISFIGYNENEPCGLCEGTGLVRNPKYIINQEQVLTQIQKNIKTESV